MFMPGVWILWSKKKYIFVIIFQKENGNTFTLLIIFIVKSLQKEQNSTNLLLWPPICRNKPAITPKWFNSLDTNSSWRRKIVVFSVPSWISHLNRIFSVILWSVKGLGMDFLIYGRNCYIWHSHMRRTFNPYNVTHTHSTFVKI